MAERIPGLKEQTFWSDDRVATLRSMWENGVPASTIAKKLGGAVTKNAVIGKAHRLKLERRDDPIKKGSSW